MLLLKIGKGFEMELDVGAAGWKVVGSVFLRLGKGFEMGMWEWRAGRWLAVFLRLSKFRRFGIPTACRCLEARQS
jgi:hypothetical protein